MELTLASRALEPQSRGKLLRGAAHKPRDAFSPTHRAPAGHTSMAFCPVPHTTRDQVWLAVGVAIGVAVTLAVSRKR